MSKKQWRMPVIGREIDGPRVLRFDSQRQAERNGFRQSSISECISGKLTQHNGFKWEEDKERDEK